MVEFCSICPGRTRVSTTSAYRSEEEQEELLWRMWCADLDLERSLNCAAAE